MLMLLSSLLSLRMSGNAELFQMVKTIILITFECVMLLVCLVAAKRDLFGIIWDHASTQVNKIYKKHCFSGFWILIKNRTYCAFKLLYVVSLQTWLLKLLCIPTANV